MMRDVRCGNGSHHTSSAPRVRVTCHATWPEKREFRAVAFVLLSSRSGRHLNGRVYSASSLGFCFLSPRISAASSRQAHSFCPGIARNPNPLCTLARPCDMERARRPTWSSPSEPRPPDSHVFLQRLRVTGADSAPVSSAWSLSGETSETSRCARSVRPCPAREAPDQNLSFRAGPVTLAGRSPGRSGSMGVDTDILVSCRLTFPVVTHS